MSPLGLVQERVSRDLHYPWRVLVCCAFLNRTTKEQARPALAAFFAWYYEPYEFRSRTAAAPEPLLRLLRPLGLVNRRAACLHLLTADYLAGASPYECFGAGRYARDALDLFCLGRTDLRPGDHWLRPYLEWRLSDGRQHRIKWDEPGHLEWLAGLWRAGPQP